MKTDPLLEFRRQMIIFAEYYDEHADEMPAERQAALFRRMCQSVADFWDLPGDFINRRGPR